MDTRDRVCSQRPSVSGRGRSRNGGQGSIITGRPNGRHHEGEGIGIIKRVAEGCKNHEIAASLGTTEHVVILPLPDDAGCSSPHNLSPPKNHVASFHSLMPPLISYRKNAIDHVPEEEGSCVALSWLLVCATNACARATACTRGPKTSGWRTPLGACPSSATQVVGHDLNQEEQDNNSRKQLRESVKNHGWKPLAA